MVLDTPEREEAWLAHAQRIAETSFAVQINPQWETWCMKPADKVNSSF